MLEKQIESTFVDPSGGHTEYEKHVKSAAEVLGDNPLLISSEIAAVVEKVTEMVEVTREVPAGYKLVTRWRTRDADPA